MPPRPVIGSQLDRTVDLLITNPARSTKSGAAQPSTDLVISNVPASYLPLRGNEMIRAGEVIADFDARFYLRWRSDLKAKDRISFDGKVYDVVSIAEVGRRQGLEVIAKTRGV